MVLSIIIMGRKLWDYRNDIEISFNISMIVQLVLCCLLFAGVVYMCPYIYKKMLYITVQKDIEYSKVAHIYCKSNVMKYLPGNVMQYIGRNELAVQEDIPHSKVALATILEVVVVVISTMLVAVLFSLSYTIEWVSKFVDFNKEFFVVVIILVIFVAAMLFLVLKKRLLNYIKDIFTWKNILIFFGTILYNSIIIILNSCIYFYVLYLLGISMNASNYLAGIGLYALAFVLGYITPGVPGGIGIRETVLVYFFSSFVLEAQILTGALVFRIVSVIGDFLGLGIAIIVNQMYKLKQK